MPSKRARLPLDHKSGILRRSKAPQVRHPRMPQMERQRTAARHAAEVTCMPARAACAATTSHQPGLRGCTGPCGWARPSVPGVAIRGGVVDLHGGVLEVKLVV